jgi:C-terminal domain 10 of the ABC-three component (ABC-3C) systems
LRDWYELKFALEFRSRLGTAFQDFFASIMERGYPTDFQKVKPYGNNGDKKCDGYHRSLRRVYQVYAPEKMQVASTNRKIQEDFTGAVEHWATSMSTWVFVHNQWRGVPADVLQKILTINGTSGVAVLSWCEVELHDEFFLLSPENQALLLGSAPTPQSFVRIQLKDVIQVASVIAQQDPPPPEEIRKVPAGKLKANSLSEYVQSLLTMGSRKSKLVKRFFDEWHDPQLGDRIARTFRSKYEELRAENIVSDEAFFELWRFSGGGSRESIDQEAAVLAVLAFLFEECEIFEAPLETTN